MIPLWARNVNVLSWVKQISKTVGKYIRYSEVAMKLPRMNNKNHKANIKQLIKEHPMFLFE